MVAADNGTLSVKRGGNAVCHDILHFGMFFLMIQTAVCRTLHNGTGNTVRKMLLDAGCNSQNLVFAVITERDRPFQNRFGIGQCTGFVKYHAVRFGESLQIFAALDGNIMVCGFPNCRDHRDRRGQLDSTGIIHHQNRHCLGDIPCQQQCQTKSQEAERHNAVCQIFGTALHAGFQVFGIVDQFNDLLDFGIAAKSTYLYMNTALIDNRSGKYGRALRLANAQRLSGHGSFVDVGFAGSDSAVYRNHTAGADTDHIAHLQLCHGNQDLCAVLHQPHLVRLYGKAVRQGCLGLGSGVVLQQCRDRQHEHDRSCRLEIPLQQARTDRGTVQHIYIQMSLQQCLDCTPRIADSLEQDHRICNGSRQQSILEIPLCHQLYQISLKVRIDPFRTGVRSQRCQQSGVQCRNCTDHLLACSCFIIYQNTAVFCMGFCLFDSGRFQQLLLHGSFQFLVECIRTAAKPNPPRLVINNLKLHYASASSHASVSLIPACSLASQQISCASSFIFWKAAFASFCSFMPFARPETAS